MINRVYFALMPSSAGGNAFLDILPFGPVGSPSAPVVSGGTGISAPPSGWVTANGDGSFFEWRSRPIRFPILSGATGFVPRTRLGYRIAVSPIVSSGSTNGSVPLVQLSASLVGPATAFATAYQSAQVADQSYGTGAVPVIRLKNTSTTQGGVFCVTFGIAEAKDEDRDPAGT